MNNHGRQFNYCSYYCQMKKGPGVRLPKKIHPLHRVRHALEMTQKDFAFQIGISPQMLQFIELGKRKLTPDLAEDVYVFTGVLPDSLKKGPPISSLGGVFDKQRFEMWQMVRQGENEEAPKRVMEKRVEALKWIGQAMQNTQRGIIWEEEFRRFLLKTIQRYQISEEIEKLKKDHIAKGNTWPDEAFLPSKEAGKRATAASLILKFKN